jgi:hypothetical protein
MGLETVATDYSQIKNTTSVQFYGFKQGITERCPLAWLTNSARVDEPKGRGGGGVEGALPISTTLQRSLRDLTPFNLWF